MKKFLTTVVLCLVGLTVKGFTAESTSKIGIVNFQTCMLDSKFGKQEQGSLEALQKQMISMLQDTEAQIIEIQTNLNDPDYRDGLSPEAEKELVFKREALQEEMMRFQNQYNQVNQQANMRMFQTMSHYINKASEEIAKEKKLAMVINKEAVFYYNNQLDVTTHVVKQMDKIFDLEGNKTPTAPVAVEEKSAEGGAHE